MDGSRVLTTSAVGLLFEAYKYWSDENNYPKSPLPVFARDLRAAVASIRLGQAGPHEKRVRVYQGIDLRSDVAGGVG